MTEATPNPGSLAEAVMRAEVAERELALRDYPRLISMETSDADTLTRLREVMRILRKTAADVQSDAALLREYWQYQDNILLARGQRPEIDRLEEELRKFDEARQQKISELNAERIRIAGLIQEREGKIRIAEAAQKAAGELYTRAPDLLGRVDPVMFSTQ